jgi:hypothetical protein
MVLNANTHGQYELGKRGAEFTEWGERLSWAVLRTREVRWVTKTSDRLIGAFVLTVTNPRIYFTVCIRTSSFCFVSVVPYIYPGSWSFCGRVGLGYGTSVHHGPCLGRSFLLHPPLSNQAMLSVFRLGCPCNSNLYVYLWFVVNYLSNGNGNIQTKMKWQITNIRFQQQTLNSDKW